MASSFRLRRATSSSLKSITDRVRRSTIQPVLISDQCRNGSQIYSPYFSSFVSSSTANLQPATGYFQNRCFRSSSVNLSSSKMFNDKEEITPNTILFEGCDYNHWLITMDFPKDPKPTDEEMVETYVQTCAKGLNISVEEAKKKMYACSTTTYNGFQALMTEEESKKFEGLPGVVFVLPDSYIDPVNKEYGGDKYIDGVIIRRPPPVQYGRSGGRYGDRNRNFDRPRYDRQGGQSFDQRGSPQGDGGSYGPPRQHNFGQSFQQSHSPPQQSPVPPPPQQNYSSPSQQNYGPSSYQNYGPPPSQSYPQPPPNNYAPPPPNNYTPPPPNNYAPSPPQNFGAPPQNFNPPPQQNFSATPQQNFGATPQPNFSATPQQNFGSPPQQFGSPPQPFGSPNQPNFGSPPLQNFSPTPQQNFSPTPQQNFSPSGQGFGAPPQQNYTTPGQNYGTPSGQGFASSQQNYSPPRDFSSNQSYGQAQNYGASQSSRPPPQQSYSQRNYDFPHQSYGPSQQNYAPQRQRPPQSYEQSSRNYDPLIQRGRNEPIFGNTDAADGVGSSSSVVGSSAHPNPLDSQQNQSTNPPQNSNGVSGQGLSDNEALNLKEVQG